MKRVGIIAALSAEARCLTKKKLAMNQIIPIDQKLLMICGMGSENASVAAKQLVEAGASRLISWGTAGALSNVAQPGDLVLPNVIVSDHDHNLETDHNWADQLSQQLPTQLKLHRSALFQSSDTIVDGEQKLQLQIKTGAIAVDMESYAIGTIARQEKLPFIVIRSIVDSSEESIPFSAIMSVDEFGQTKPASLISNILKRPTDIPKLIRLGNHFKLAQKTLQSVSDSVGTTFAV